MKTIKFLTTVFVVSALFSCDVKQTEPPTPPPPPTAPKTLISLEEARVQLQNYNTAHPGVRGEQYALRTWISIEDLEQYIAYVKSESKNKNIQINGIDFIYTQYKEAKPGMSNAGNADYELTFMYAPTYKDGSSNVAFDPVNSEDGKPAKLSELLANRTNNKDADSDTDSTSQKGGPSGIANNAASCPTVCP